MFVLMLVIGRSMFYWLMSRRKLYIQDFDRMYSKGRVLYFNILSSSRSESLQLPINLNLLENLHRDTLYDVEYNHYSQTSRRSHIGQRRYLRR